MLRRSLPLLPIFPVAALLVLPERREPAVRPGGRKRTLGRGGGVLAGRRTGHVTVRLSGAGRRLVRRANGRALRATVVVRLASGGKFRHAVRLVI